MNDVVLLTGANGFVGSNLLKSLSYNYDVVAISRSKPKFKCKWVKFVTLSEINFTEVFKNYKPKFVIHCAAIAHNKAPFFKKNEKYLKNINLVYTRELIKASLLYKPLKFIFISSISVFSYKPKMYINEKSELGPTNLYAEFKLQSEKDIQENFNNSSVSWTIIRPPLIYGNGAPGNINLLIKIVDLKMCIPLQKKPIYKSLLSINNLISAIGEILVNEKSNNQVYVISDDKQITLFEFIKLISKIRSKPFLIFFPPKIIYEVLKIIPLLGSKFKTISNEYKLDNTKIKEQLNWTPPFLLKSEIIKAYSRN